MTGNPPIGQTVIDQGVHNNLHLHFAIQLPNNQWVDDQLLKLVNFSGNDSISDHFQYQLELHGNSDPAKESSPNVSLRFEELIGRPITVGIDQPNEAEAKGLPAAADPYSKRESCALFADAVQGKWSADGSAEERFSLFNGIVASFAMTEPGVYQLTMRPAAWKATLTNRYRIHTQKNIRDAISGVLEEHGIDFSMDAVSGDDNPAIYRVQDWLQAGESDYDFIHRLMGKAHIYYYYLQGAEKHTLFFANRPDYAAVYASGHKLRYAFTNEDALALEQEDLITQYRYEQSLSSSGIDATLSRQQAAWEKCTVADFSTYRDASDEDRESKNPGDLPFHRFQIVQYGGSKGEVAWETDRTARSLATSATTLSGGGHCSRFRAGHQFQMDDAAAPGVSPTQIRPTLPEQPFVLTRVDHKASLDGNYTNQFQATEASGLVTPFSLQDTQQGSVLAQVVNVDNGTPPNDWKYYYKDNFDPEQSTLTDDDSSEKELRAQGVYVKFATDTDADAPRWVKLAAHMQTAPEIGVTVMVSRSYFADELPEIQSIVQNNGNKTVTPCGWTASTNVGSNYSTSYGDSKSIRFGLKSAADLDNAKGIVEGEYDTGEFRDSSYSQGASYSYSTSESARSGLLSKSDSFGRTYSTFESDETKSVSDITYSYSKSTIGKTESISDIGTSDSTSTIGTSNSTSDITTSNSTSTVGTSDSTSTVGTSTSTSDVGVSTSTSTVGVSDSTSTVGTSTSTSLVGLSNSTSAVGLSTSLSTVGVSSNTSMVGVSDSLNVVGVSSSIGVTGVSTGVSVTGVSDGTSVTGLSSNTSVTGLSDSTGVVGLSNSTNMVGLSNSTNLTGLSNSTNLTGLSNGTQLTGLSVNTGLTGMSTNTNLTGMSVGANLTGMSTSANLTGVANEMSLQGMVNSMSIKGVGNTIDVTGTGVSLQSRSGVLDLNNKGTDLQIMAVIQIIL